MSMHRLERRNLARGLAFLSPWLIGFSAFTLIPVCLAIYYSFCDLSLGRPVFRGWINFSDLLHDKVFWQSLGNTFQYAAMAIPAGMLVSFGLALMLNVRIPGQAIYRTIIFLPTLVPTVAAAMLWLWLFNTKLGLINAALGIFHIPAVPWLTDARWAMPSLALMSLWGVGHTVIIYLAGLQDVPQELYEAAEIDGAGFWCRLRNVTIPTVSPVIFFNLVMAIIGTFQFPTTAYNMTGGGPNRATYFYSMYLYDNAFSYIKFGYASAMAVFLLIIVMILTALAFWSSRRWVHYQGR